MVEEAQPRSLAYGMSMRGRIAMITGGATGIGKAIALEFARHGAHVCFNYYSYDGARRSWTRPRPRPASSPRWKCACTTTSATCATRRQVEKFVADVNEKMGGPSISW